MTAIFPAGNDGADLGHGVAAARIAASTEVVVVKVRSVTRRCPAPSVPVGPRPDRAGVEGGGVRRARLSARVQLRRGAEERVRHAREPIKLALDMPDEATKLIHA